MNCCNEKGECTQGFGCPVREVQWAAEYRKEQRRIKVWAALSTIAWASYGIWFIWSGK